MRKKSECGVFLNGIFLPCARWLGNDNSEKFFSARRRRRRPLEGGTWGVCTKL